jgi:hypothetical protein
MIFGYLTALYKLRRTILYTEVTMNGRRSCVVICKKAVIVFLR